MARYCVKVPFVCPASGRIYMRVCGKYTNSLSAARSRAKKYAKDSEVVDDHNNIVFINSRGWELYCERKAG